jgi:hypothetical protein
MSSAFDQFQLNESDTRPDMGTGKEFACATLFYLFVFAILFSPVIFTGHFLAPDDGFVQNLPNFFGRRSLWSLSIYSGYPLLADPLVQYFYPLPLLLSHVPQGWNIYILTGYVFSGSFLYLYLRMLTKSAFASLLGGLFYCMSGYLLCETLHVHVVQTAMWFAAMLTIFEYMARDLHKSAKAFVLGALALCLCTLNGHLQTLAYLLGVMTLYVPVRALSLPAKGAKIKYVLACYSILATGLLLSAMQLLPTAELAKFSARSLFTFQDFLTYDMHPLEALGVFLPFLFGGAPDGIISQPYFASFICPLGFVYLGYVPIFLSLAVLFSFFGNRLVIFWAIVGIVTFLLAFGDFTPLAWILYHLPPFGSFRCLHRILLVTALANSVLAGLAVSALQKGILPGKRLTLSTATIVCAFIGLLVTVSTIHDVLAGQATKYGVKNLGVLPWNNPAIGASTILFIFSLGAIIAFASRPGRSWTKILITTLAIVDLALLGWYAQGGQWRLRSAEYNKIEAPLTAQKYVPLANQNYNRILAVRGGSGTLDELPNNLCRLWNVPSASGYEPLMLARYGNLLNISEGGFLFPSWQYSASDRSFDLLSIKYATTELGDARLEKLVDKNGASAWHKVENLGTACIHENTRLMPRCWLVDQVQKHSESEILKAIKTSRLPDGQFFDPALLALTEEDIDFQSDANAATIGADQKIKADLIKIITLSDNYIKVEIKSKNTAVLILSDIYYPCWNVYVDDKPTKIFRVDYLLRGLVIPKGQHTVEFKLHSSSLNWGFAVSALALILLIGGYAALRLLDNGRGAQPGQDQVGKRR